MSSREHKIRVGIDAKWFFDGPPSGHMVVKNLVNEIISNNKGQFKLYLFIKRKFRKEARAYFPDGVQLIFLPGMPNLLSNLLLLPLMAFFFGIDVLLFQNFGSAWPAKVFKIAYIHDVLFLDHPQYYTKAEQAYFKQMIRFAASADKIITISNTEKERMVKYYVASETDIEVVYHGINPNFKPLNVYTEALINEIDDRYSLPQKYLLYVGRVNIRKNLVNLVRAISMLDKYDIKLVIAGERSDNYPALSQYIADKKLWDKIVFTGHVPEHDLYVIYARATVFCFPSYAEGFGLPPLEAMQCGVPVVVSNRTAMPEVCGSAALYLNPDDENDIARQIELLLTSKALYDAKVKQGLDRAAGFSWQFAANEILTIINNAYADRRNNQEAETEPQLQMGK